MQFLVPSHFKCYPDLELIIVEKVGESLSCLKKKKVMRIGTGIPYFLTETSLPLKNAVATAALVELDCRERSSAVLLFCLSPAFLYSLTL